MPTYPPRRGLAVKIALVGGGAVAGVIAATALGAAATTTTSGTGTGSSSLQAASSTMAPPPPGARHFDHGGADPVRSDEKTLGTALTAKLKAEALKAVPGGTVYRIESDSGDATYEAHMTKKDGNLVTVKFDKNGNVTGVEQGMGKG